MPDIELDDILDILKEREERWANWLSVTARLRKLVGGRWGEVYASADGEQDTEWPMIANLFRDTVEDIGRRFGRAMPQDRADKAGIRDQGHSEKREQALAAYGEESNFYDSLELYGMDMVGAGLCAVRVWPKFSEPINKRFPIYRRINPEIIRLDPDWSPDQPSDNVILHYMRPTRDLKTEFEEPVGQLIDEITEDKSRGQRLDEQRLQQEASPPQLEVVDFYSTKIIYRLALHRDSLSGREYMKALVMRENDTEHCPVQVAPRYSWTLDPMSMLEDSIGTARTRNRYWKLVIDYFARLVYGPLLTWRIRKPDLNKRIWHALSPDAFAKPVGADSMSPQVFDILSLLEREERVGKVDPLSREADLDLNKATAAFLTKAQGKHSDVVESLANSFKNMKRHANSTGLAQDEKWCDGKNKEITGKHRGRRFRTTYTPSEVIKGDYQNRVVYGTPTGQDPVTNQILALQKHDRGLMSDEEFLEMDPTIDDASATLMRIRQGRIANSILAGMEMPEVDLVTRIKIALAFQEARKKNQDVDEFIANLESILAQPAEPAAPAPTPAGPPELEAGTRPGLPSEAPIVEFPSSVPGIRRALARR